MRCVLFGCQCGGEAQRNQRFLQDRESVQLILFIVHQIIFLRDLKDKGFLHFLLLNSQGETWRNQFLAICATQEIHVRNLHFFLSNWDKRFYSCIQETDVCLSFSFWKSNVLLCKQDLIHLQSFIAWTLSFILLFSSPLFLLQEGTGLHIYLVQPKLLGNHIKMYPFSLIYSWYVPLLIFVMKYVPEFQIGQIGPNKPHLNLPHKHLVS